MGHGLGILALLLVILVHVGQQPRSLKRLTWATFAVYILLADVVIFMRNSLPLVAALHPVLAITLFGLTVTMTIQAWRAAREENMVAVAPSPEAAQEVPA